MWYDEYDRGQNTSSETNTTTTKKLIPPPLPFIQTSKRQINYDDILSSMHLYLKEGKLHKASPVETEPDPHPHPQPLTKEELIKKKLEHNKMLWLQQREQEAQRRHILEAKSRQIRYVNDNTSYSFQRIQHTQNTNLNKMFQLMKR